jgi:hypothetical protein
MTWEERIVTYTVIRFSSTRAKFGTTTVVSLDRTPIEDKIRRFKGEDAHFIFNKCPIYTHDGACAKFSTNSDETDNRCTAGNSFVNRDISIGSVTYTQRVKNSC